MNKKDRYILSALIQAMSENFSTHMEEVYGEQWLVFRDKYYFEEEEE